MSDYFTGIEEGVAKVEVEQKNFCQDEIKKKEKKEKFTVKVSCSVHCYAILAFVPSCPCEAKFCLEGFFFSLFAHQ